MAEKILMLALSPTMEKGTIIKWHKREGDPISSGQVLAEVETDKAVMDYQSGTEGTLLKILVPEGASAAVEQLIAIAGRPGEDISAMLESLPTPAGQAKPETPVEVKSGETEACPIPSTAKPTEAETPAPVVTEEKVRSSPLARKLAQETGLDINTIEGSGPDGRVTRQDVERAIRERPAAKPPRTPERTTPKVTAPLSPVAELKDETLPVSTMRKTIAERLSRSKFTAPHFYLRISVHVDSILEARTRYNAQAAEKLSLNAYLMKLAAEAIKRHPIINSTWKNDAIIKHGRIDIALAVAVEDGLTAPVVRDCGAKGIIAIDREIRQLVDKARSRQLRPDDYENATFTISNLGSYGIEEFTAIINPPGSAILAVGVIERKPVVDDRDQIVIQSMMTLTLSCDHRTIDGAAAAAFLRDLKSLMERPVEAMY